VILIGEMPVVDDLARLCTGVGWSVSIYLAEEAVGPGGRDRMQADAANADVAIDAVSTSIPVKRQAVAALDAGLPRDALLLTSALSTTATQAGSWARRPERTIGFAALPPLGKGGTIELAAGLRSNARVVDRAREFVASIGLEPVLVKDSVGLVLPRIVCGLANEAAGALAEGVADAMAIDTAMRLGTNYPRGPLEWADLIGLDLVLAVLEGLQQETGDDRYRPVPILKQYVRAGWLGRKSGKGFYTYTGQ
jgi:3-hydroxybutyryl-CoA dehydrogenase